MSRSTLVFILTFHVGLLLAWSALHANAQDTPTAIAVRVTEPIRLDGVLDDGAWAQARLLGAFVQREPLEGGAPSEDTDVRVVYDGEALYFGILCRDRDPSRIVSTQLGRDADLAVDDQVTIVIDPFFDQRNGFFFMVNPGGARADGQISNNAEEMSLDWDTIWDAKARVTEQGWSAEVKIPFKSLRFEPSELVWGLNVERLIKRANETVRWANARNDVWITNLAEAGRLEGLSGLQQGKGLDIRPFLSGGEVDRDGTFKAGLDVVKSLTPNLTASVTVNTDFAETEVDSRQINLTRFPLFFPEKRTFFLEGAGVYDVAGLGGSAGEGPPPDLLPFFSRTIGLRGRSGEEVPILVGAKLSGRQSDYNIGVLDVQTQGVDLDEGRLGSQNLFAARLSRNLLEQSWVGVIATNGDPTGAGANTLVGVDARFATSNFRGNQNLSLDVFALRTDDGASGRVAYAEGIRVEYPNDRWRGGLGVKQVGEGFRPALGFAPRTSIRKFDGELAYQPRPGRFGIRQVSLGGRPQLITDLDGRTESWEVFTMLPEVQFESGEEAAVNWAPAFERLVEPFEIQPGVIIPPGDYRWSRCQLEVSTASKRPVVAEVALWLGGFYSGTMRQVEAALMLKPNSHLAIGLEMERSDASLPQGDFVAQVFAGRLDVNPSTNITWANQVQYDSDSRVLGFQSRFRWILKPGNDLFFVIGSGWDRRFDGGYAHGYDKGSVKLQYTFRL